MNNTNFNLVINKISELLRKKEMVVFVGAGLSMNSGSKSWEQLISKFKEELPSDARGLSYMDIAEYYERKWGRHKLISTIEDELISKNQNTELQNKICKWPVNTIITTNFDNFLEEGCKKSNIQYKVFYPSDLFKWNQTRDLKILKMHGDFSKDLIITKTNFSEYGKQYGSCVTLLKSILETTSVLFIGCSLTDPNFEKIYDEALSESKSYGHKHYAILNQDKEYHTDRWKDVGMNIIQLDVSKEVIQDFIQNISNKLSPIASTREKREKIFDEYETKFIEYSQSLTVRKETSLGFLATSDFENHFNNRDHSIERWKNARKKKETYQKFIDNGSLLQIILDVDPVYLEKRGYSGFEEIRLRALSDFLEKNMVDNFQIVSRPPGISHENFTIYNNELMIDYISTSSKPSYRFDEHVKVTFDLDLIEKNRTIFDTRFKIFMEYNLSQAKKHHITGTSEQNTIKNYILFQIEEGIRNMKNKTS